MTIDGNKFALKFTNKARRINGRAFKGMCRMKKKISFQKKYSADYYAVISFNPKNISRATEIIDDALSNGIRHIKFEIDAEKWKDSQIANLKRKLKDMSGFIVKNIALGENVYILNFSEAEDNRDCCPFWGRMIANDSRGNFILAPLSASSREKGVIMGKVGGDMSFYSSCVYRPKSEQCAECQNKNFKKMSVFWNMNAVNAFDSAISVLYETIKVLSFKKPKFKRYLKELSLILESKSEFLKGLKFQ